MKIKAKKCKGTGKARGFDSCTEMALVRTYGLCRKCYKRWLLTTEAGKEKMQKSIITAKRNVARIEKKKELKRKRDQKINTTNYKTKLQTKINEIVRLIDIGHPCLAKRVHSRQIHAGHVWSRGSQQTMRYNLHNIHRQGAQSNWHQSDDLLMQEGLVIEYGQEYRDFVENLKRTPALKYSNIEYKEFYEKACKLAIALRKYGRTFNKKERIQLRNNANMSLGIYPDMFCNY